MSALSLVPRTDMVAFSRLPTVAKNEAMAWRDALAPALAPGARIGDVVAAAARLFGVSIPTAHRKLAGLRRAGLDGVLNRSRCRLERRGLSKGFIEFLRATAENHQRCSAQAFYFVHGLWMRKDRSLEVFPEYRGFPNWPNLPEGWSKRNFYRLLSSKMVLTVARQGVKAASALQPKVFSTRAELWPGSHYMLDDVWHDVHVVFAGEVVRPLELGVMDVFSAAKFCWGIKPRIRKQDGTREQIGERCTRFALASALWNYGYSARGTTLMAEHGTAAIRELIESILREETDGLVTVQRSVFEGDRQGLLGWWGGKGGGNPRFKAPLESFHNLTHNVMGALPGQSGHDRNPPEWWHGQEKETLWLLKKIESLSDDDLKKIKVPVWLYHSQFLPYLSMVYGWINSRTDHSLEGFNAAGLLSVDYRLHPESDDWLSPEKFLALPAVSQQLLTSIVQGGDRRFFRQRLLSPAEVWNRRDLKRIEPHVVARILQDDLAVERKTDGGYFEFQDAEVDAEPMLFEARIALREGGFKELPDGERFLTFVNPFSPDDLFVHDAQGGFLGVARRVHRVPRGDADAFERECGHVASRKAARLEDFRRRHASDVAVVQDLRRHNEDVLAGNPMTPQEKERARLLKRQVAAVSDAEIDNLVSGRTDVGPELDNMSEEESDGLSDSIL